MTNIFDSTDDSTQAVDTDNDTPANDEVLEAPASYDDSYGQSYDASSDEEGTKSARKIAQPTKHARFMRGIVTPIFGLLAVAACVMGILYMTVLKPSRIVAASAQMSGQYVVLDAGVANLVSPAMSFSAAAPAVSTSSDSSGAQPPTVCVAVTSATDVDGWIAASGVDYVRVTGLKSWSELATSSQKASSKAQDSTVEFADSDLWSVLQCAKTKATVRSLNATSSQKIIAYSKDGIEKISMTWTRPQAPETAMPWFAAFGVLAVIAVLCASWWAQEDPFGIKRRRDRATIRKAQAAAQGAASGAGAAAVEGVDVPYEAYKKKSTTGITHRVRKPSVFDSIFKKTSSEGEGAAVSGVASTPVVAGAASTVSTVVDPSSVHLVASTGSGMNDTAWSPSVIAYTPTEVDVEMRQSVQSDVSAGNVDVAVANVTDTASTGVTGEELLDYFARLAIENMHNQKAQTDAGKSESPVEVAQAANVGEHVESALTDDSENFTVTDSSQTSDDTLSDSANQVEE